MNVRYVINYSGHDVSLINTKLSSSTTVGQYQTLVKAGDRAKLAKFIVERFDERYFRPIYDSQSKHGFATMAVACLVIETLEAFYQGLGDTKGQSKKMFRDFFNRCSDFSEFSKDGDWFYTDIRCGILHQAESRNGWKIIRTGKVLNRFNKTINATLFLKMLNDAVLMYSVEIQSNEQLWEKFCNKVDEICKNCQ